MKMFLLEQQLAERGKLHLLQSEPDSRLQTPALDSAVLHSDPVHRGSPRLHRGSDQQLHRSDLQQPAVSTQYGKIRQGET